MGTKEAVIIYNNCGGGDGILRFQCTVILPPLALARSKSAPLFEVCALNVFPLSDTVLEGAALKYCPLKVLALKFCPHPDCTAPQSCHNNDCPLRNV